MEWNGNASWAAFAESVPLKAFLGILRFRQIFYGPENEGYKGTRANKQSNTEQTRAYPAKNKSKNGATQEPKQQLESGLA